MAKKKLENDKLPAAVELGHRGGLKGGPARAKALTPKRLKEIAAMGGKARWSEANLHAEDDPAVAKKFRELNP